MSEPTMMYGQAKSEKLAAENQTCRQIIKEINNFGVNDRQRLLLIYLLGIELENVERMRAITCLTKDLAGSELFISGNVEDTDGSINV